jgi:two-component system C4-dicarboxylate transport sensor histidine kinase DctB
MLTQGPTALNDKMQGLVTRMESTTKQLKFFSRKGRDQFEALDLRTVLDPALDLLAPNITQIRARVSVESPELPLPVFGNRMRLEQVVTNVLRNALDAVETSETRQIDIGMGCDEDHVWLSVSDSGHGLGDQTFEDLREPFATSRESGKGMGLGLTISAGIVADHQGTISARNGASGGAEFRIELPRHNEAQDDGA